MSSIDWILLVLPVIAMLALAIYTKRFVRGVADFLAAGRCAGRYLLCNAKGESASGLANTMGKFELVMISGFTLSFWDQLSVPIVLLVSVTGFVIYRYRETRALTVSQFLEMRYSRRFRIFMGAMAFVAGVLNYGIFPAVSARFFVYFLGLPDVIHAGQWAVPTFVPVMAVTLTISILLLLFGGQVALLLTDCVEGIISHAVYMLVVIAIFCTVGWSQIVKVTTDQPHNHSMINPFDAWDVSDFNVWYVVMNLILTIYGTMAFQTSNGSLAAARTPHESRMSGVLGAWRGYARSVMLLVVTLGAVAYLRHSDFVTTSAPARAALAAVKDPQVRKQVTIPVALSFLLPTGVKGLFCGVMMMGLMASDITHIGTWSSIFIQDVVLPLRKTQPSPKQHIWLLRWSVAMVAVFAFLFSALFRQTSYITIWMTVSAGVFMAGAGAVIIGGLYSRWGSTQAAWACMLVGSTLSLTHIVAQNQWDWIVKTLAAHHMTVPAVYPLGGVSALFICSCVAALVYVLVSMMSRQELFDLQRMLRRDRVPPPDEREERLSSVAVPRRSLVARLLGFDEHFTRVDRWVTVLMLGWSLTIALSNICICAYTVLIHSLSTAWWARYWSIVGVGVPFCIALVSLVWFSIGATFDIRDFFHILRTKVRDARDNGQVTRAEHNALHRDPLSSASPDAPPPAELTMDA